jgi:hypothetical protein
LFSLKKAAEKQATVCLKFSPESLLSEKRLRVYEFMLARAKPTPGACGNSITQIFGKVYNYFFDSLCMIFQIWESQYYFKK